ncbi:ABC transporter permease [Herbidospora galbida]|uniref:Transport permease protein n=1 Tax=Herbidospora galbida TaxID=2575442 RepID=A0A4U3M9T9_9ACTN|nr:ABC transporter permease [Herbidospora galbida]TKK85868.1 ABC transporter permease [Herbidospora galbida]
MAITAPQVRRLTSVETKLYLREPAAIFFAIGLPIGLFLILGGTIPDFMKADPELGGLRPIDTHLPGMMILLCVLTCAFSLLPTVLVTYRERGILRRMSTTPVSPVTVLGVQLVLNVATTLVTTLLMLVIGNLVYDVPFPRAPLAFTGVLLLGMVSSFAIGLLLAALSRNSRVAQGLGMAVFFPNLFFAGMWVPRALMPEAVRVVADFTPSGAFGAAIVQVLTDGTAQWLHIGVMAAWAVGAGVVAVRFFRWS